MSYGIDLGTTNSCIAHFNGDRAHVFQNSDQMSVTPSVVRIEKSGRIIVGRRAYASKMANPTNVASEFKRWMGQKDKHTFQASGRQLSAEKLSSEILKALLEDVCSQTDTSVDAAVITVPAAFGQLQCEATARAAAHSGLSECVLLQEPIAAAIAYGISPNSKDQRWMVFDLGGGTFDVAVVSSRDGRLTVLEHRGNNHLGGKDIDRMIVEKLLMPVLDNEFNLPSKQDSPLVHQSLIQRLHLKAEEAKIDLTRNEKVIVSLFDLGEDLDGNAIEGEVEIRRKELDDLCEPLLDKCIALCDEAVEGARTTNANLDRIVLVGGPTNMPIVRRTLEERFNVKLDHSIDPMTIVAQGAAIHAAGIEREINKSPVQIPTNLTSETGVSLILAYEPVSSSLQCPVDGRINGEERENVFLKIDAESGHWTSGWIEPSNGIFEASVSLLEGKSNKFWIYARNEQGKPLDTVPDSFTIRHGLTIASPPLPHTISVEIVKPDGTTELEPIFKRGSALPNEFTKSFRANKTLRPSEVDSIAIKLWEGETLTDPEANELVGNLLIESQYLKRPLAEGSEIELTVAIDTSRRMIVTAFVPKLNEHFSDRIYVPQRDEEEFTDLAQKIPSEIEQHFDRLNEIEESIDTDDEETLKQVDKLRQQLEELDLEVESKGGMSTDQDPDQAKRLVSESKNIRANLGKLENKTVSSAASKTILKDIMQRKPGTELLVTAAGTAVEKKEFSLLERELERALEKNDERGLKKVADGLQKLYFRVLFKQDWFWSEAFKELRDDTKNYTNKATAKQLIAAGEEAVRKGDGEKLRGIVQELWELQPKEDAELDREKAMQAGIRRL